MVQRAHAAGVAAVDRVHAGRSVRPLRVAAETARAAVRAAAANESAGDGQSTTSFVPSTDSDAGSGTTLTDVSEL